MAILDEPIVVPISLIQVSCKGDFIKTKSMRLEPPTPRMAKDTFRMKKYFTKIQKEGAKALLELADKEGLIEQAKQQQLELKAGEDVKKLHEEYSDDNKDDKLAKIEESIGGITQILELCDGIDLYQMTADFGKLLFNNGRCKLLEDVAEDVKGREQPLDVSIWEQQIKAEDRLAAAIRYCCFFGLTSSMMQ